MVWAMTRMPLLSQDLTLFLLLEDLGNTSTHTL